MTQLNAELVLFLHYVWAWKLRWSKLRSNWDDPGNQEARVMCYAHAALIYFTLVDDKAYYPINIHPTRRNSLAVLFRFACYAATTPTHNPDTPSTPDSGSTKAGDTTPEKSTASRPATPATPWDVLRLDDTTSRIVTQKQMTEVKIDASEALKKIEVLPADTTRRLMTARQDSAMDVTVYREIDAPASMDLNVFEGAVKEVQMQAYHNVWLPFVKSGEYRKAYF